MLAFLFLFIFCCWIDEHCLIVLGLLLIHNSAKPFLKDGFPVVRLWVSKKSRASRFQYVGGPPKLNLATTTTIYYIVVVFILYRICACMLSFQNSRNQLITT